MNVLDQLPKTRRGQARALLTRIPYSDTQEQAEKLKRDFQAWCRKHAVEAAGELLDRDWGRLLTFYSFPREHWLHLRTTNIVESPFAAVRLRTTAAKRYKKVANATAVIWKTLQIAERHFRNLTAPDRLAEVADGATYVNGLRTKGPDTKISA